MSIDEELFYIINHTSNRPYQITVHRETCYNIFKAWKKDKFNKEDWPNTPEYYVVGCNICKPNLGE